MVGCVVSFGLVIQTASSQAPVVSQFEISALEAACPQSQRLTPTAAAIPMICATMTASTPPGAIPANVSDNARAKVTAGFANEVEAVNQYAAVM